MAVIRKTTYRCDACGEIVGRKGDLRQLRVETGAQSYSRYSTNIGIKADFCADCETNFIDALAPFFGTSDAVLALGREPRVA